MPRHGLFAVAVSLLSFLLVFPSLASEAAETNASSYSTEGIVKVVKLNSPGTPNPASLTPDLGAEEACNECGVRADQMQPLSTMKSKISQLTEEAPAARVNAVLIWMEGCPFCHEVIEDVLPPLERQYGDALEILLVQIETLEQIDGLFALGDSLRIPRENVGVPFLLIGEWVLIGAAEIPEHLPGLVERYHQSGGVPTPDIAALDALMQEARVEPFTLSSAEDPFTGATTLEAEQVETPDGFDLAIAVLIGMLISLLYGLWAVARAVRDRHAWLPPMAWTGWIPILGILGIGVAAYLSFIETQNAVAVCGPVGDCNAVQQSEYASIFGVPVGVLGLVGYGLILAAWWMGTHRTKSRWGKLAPTALFVMTTAGLLFSVYLTYLEPFVIRAVCLWCLSSSVIIALLYLLSLSPFLDRISKRA